MVANWFNQMNTFLWGDITQNRTRVGNLCADLNGMPGAPAVRDGEDAVSPLFRAMADTAEQEVMEEEVPSMQLVSKRLVRDNMGLASSPAAWATKMIVAERRHPALGLHDGDVRSEVLLDLRHVRRLRLRHLPLAMVKGVNAYDAIRRTRSKFDLSIEKVMNEQPFEGGK